MTLKNGFDKCSLFVLSANGWKDEKKKKKKKNRWLRFRAKENPNALFDWSIALQYDVKAKNRLISRKFSGVMFFHPSVRLTNKKRISPWETSGKRCL